MILVVGVMMLSAEGMGRSAMILASCVGMTGLLAYVAVVEVPGKQGEPRQSILQRFLHGPPSASSASRGAEQFANDSVKELVDKFRLEMAEVRDSILLLTHICRRVRGGGKEAQAAAKSAFELGLLESSLLFLQQLEPDDKRIPLAADIINELVSKDAIRKTILAEDDHLKNILDGLLIAIQDLAKPTPKEAAEARPEREESGKEKMKEKEEEDEEGSLCPPPKKIANALFPVYGYKLIMAVGLLCMDDREAQTLAGDRGTIKVVGDVFQHYGPQSAEVVKWCCWTMIHLTYDHPPNKREFYQRGGIVQVVDALKQHASSNLVYEQALGLIINVLIYDSQTKMNQSQARQAALASNIFEVLQRAQKEFKSQDAIQAMITQILQILIQDWS